MTFNKNRSMYCKPRHLPLTEFVELELMKVDKTFLGPYWVSPIQTLR